MVYILFPGKKPTDPLISRMKYQLLHYLVGSHSEGATYVDSKKPLKKRKNFAEIVVMPVLSFKTSHTNSNLTKPRENLEDYNRFFRALKFFKRKSMSCFDSAYCGKMDGQPIYTFSKTIDMT